MEERKNDLIREAREVEIRGIEKDIRVTFPRSYREFLLNREEIEKEAGFELPVLGLPKPQRKREPERRKEKESFPGIDLEKMYQDLEALQAIIEGEDKAKEDEMSVLAATQFLRTQRSDLEKERLICVRLIGDWAVCLDLRERPEEDCPLIQVNRKDKEIPIIQTSPSFRGSIEKAIRDYQRALAAKQRVANRREEVEGARGREFSHQQPK